VGFVFANGSRFRACGRVQREMANRQEIERLYDWLDRFHDRCLGEFADLSCGYFRGDHGKSLRQAQKDKHDWVLDTMECGEGSRILDIGSGWGAMLRAAELNGVSGVGLTLSQAQAAYCRKKRLNVLLMDWKEAQAAQLGVFDGIVSIGAFEHFCAIEEFLAGKQEGIYKRFFQLCADVIKSGRKLFLQTMVWADRVPDPEKCRLTEPARSTERIVARIEKFYPGSWLPVSKEQIVRAALPYFRLVSTTNGREDYIETLKRWHVAIRGLFGFTKLLPTLKDLLRLAPRYAVDRDFREQIKSIVCKDQLACFERRIMDHERMFFVRR